MLFAMGSFLVNVFNGGLIIEAEVLHIFEKVFGREVGVFVAVFSDEFETVGYEFAVSALSDDEFFIFEFLKCALHGVRIDFGERSEIAHGR